VAGLEAAFLPQDAVEVWLKLQQILHHCTDADCPVLFRNKALQKTFSNLMQFPVMNNGMEIYIHTRVYPKVSRPSHNEINNKKKKNTRREATQRVMAEKLTRLTHKIVT
jgi:hypothetical protein